MSTEAQKRATKKYQKNNTVHINLHLIKGKDDDIIQFLEAQKDKTNTIRRALRHEIFEKL